MAMTKKERAEFDAALKAARVAGALRWTTPIAPDLSPPSASESYVGGWLFNAHSMVVERSWTGCVSHGSGDIPLPGKYRSGSQGSRCLYSTKALALKAMRASMERMFAEKLAAVDALIADEPES